MPLALLLSDQAKAWTDGVAAWEPWEGILELESRILERARSIFLVRWFGGDLPLDGPRLRVRAADLPVHEVEAGVGDRAEQKTDPERPRCRVHQPHEHLGAAAGHSEGEI